MDWLRKLLKESSDRPEQVKLDAPLQISFQDLRGGFFPPETLLECIFLTAGGDATPINASAMGVKLTRGEYLLVQPFVKTDTYANLSHFPFATVNFTTNPLVFARCALNGWGEGPDAPELDETDLHFWNDFPLPSLRLAFLSLKCMREPMDSVKVGPRGMFLLSVKGAALLTPNLPLTNRADNLALEAVVHATRVRVFLEQGDIQLAKDLLTTIKKYDNYIKSNALEGSPAWETIDQVNAFIDPLRLKIR